MTANPSADAIRRSPRGAGFLVGGLLLALVAAVIFCGWVFNLRLQRFYTDFIHPQVSVLGVDVGGLTPQEAQAQLAEIVIPADEILILRDSARRWSVPLAEAGLTLDAEATAQAAYAVGRGGGTLREQLAAWFAPREVAPIFTVDLDKARIVLEQLSNEVSVLPVDAGIGLENGRAVVVPGKPGRVLDITALLGQLQSLPASTGGEVMLDLVYRDVLPIEPDTADVQAQAEVLLDRQIYLSAYDVLTGETLTRRLGREEIAPWLRLVPRADGTARVDVAPDAVTDTLVAVAAGLGDGRGFRLEEATRQVLDAFSAGGGSVTLYLSHPQRTYTVEAGDTLGRIGAKFGMPPGLIAEVNSGVDLDHLSVGQLLTIPSQDELTPYLPAPGKKIVISIAEQRLRAYENGVLLYDYLVSTGMKDSPTYRGTFQIVNKDENAYASQWDLQMPYFMGFYRAGGGVYNGIHELPILANGQRLWAGNLGHPASFGCVILGIPDAETLFDWADIGVLVVVE